MHTPVPVNVPIFLPNLLLKSPSTIRQSWEFPFKINFKSLSVSLLNGFTNLCWRGRYTPIKNILQRGELILINVILGPQLALWLTHFATRSDSKKDTPAYKSSRGAGSPLIKFLFALSTPLSCDSVSTSTSQKSFIVSLVV